VASLILAACSCQLQVIEHDEIAAAKGAERFLQLLILDHKAAAAYEMLSDAARREISLSLLEMATKEQHPDGYPVTISSTEYEPVPGQAAMQIFLVGERGPQHFYYRVPMFGTASSGYRPGGFLRGSGPYPPSSLRQPLSENQ
jgi:hypothetical protein